MNKLYILYSFILSLIVATFVIFFIGLNPLEVYQKVFQRSFTIKNLSNIIIKASPIILTGLSVAWASKAGLFNIGGEGQFIIGSLGAWLVAFFLPLPFIIHPIVAIFVGGLFGGLVGSLCGYLKAKFHIHEVLSTIMLNWIMLYFNNFFIELPFVKRPNSNSSYKVLDSSKIEILSHWKRSHEGIKWAIAHKDTFLVSLYKTKVNFAILIALVFIFVFLFILKKTTLGYKIKAVGSNKHAADYAGIKSTSIFVISMFIAGFIAGVAGSTNVLGRNFQISKLSMMESNGFNGIAVAFMANNNFIGVIFSGILFGFLFQAGMIMQSNFNIPTEIINLLIGCILVFISAPAMFNFLKKKSK